MAMNKWYGRGPRVILDRLAGIPLRYLAGTTLVGTYVLMLLGAYTSAIGAGLACPDWPTCYGTWVPFLNPEIAARSPYSTVQIFAEWSHRSVAALVGVLILGTAVVAWRTGRQRPLVRVSAAAAVVLLPIQILLGGLTVTGRLKPLIVTAHLGVALLILVALTILTVRVWGRKTSYRDADRRTS